MNFRNSTPIRALRPVLISSLLGLVVAALSVGAGPGTTQAAGGNVKVYYAGSLTNLNETLVGPAFSNQSGYSYQGTSEGSLAIVNQVKGRIAAPDVIELADPSANSLLMGNANGNFVSWYFTFARTKLVVGFDPRGKYASKFRAVQQHKLAWHKPLEQKGIRLGRTDPNLDPKGYRALFMASLAQKVYHLKNFSKRIFGAAENEAQVFPEETLVARMLTGQIDAGIFYLSEVRDLGIPYINLPSQVNLGEQKYARLYSSVSYTTTAGARIVGAPIAFTLTIPSTATNVAGAQAFVHFVLTKRMRSIAANHGLLPTTVVVHGNRGAVPAPLVTFIGEH